MNVRPVPARGGVAERTSVSYAKSIYRTANDRTGNWDNPGPVRNPPVPSVPSVTHPAKLPSMKAVVITSLSGPDALSVQDAAEPTLKPGQTLVRVAAGGLNFADVMTTQGGYPGTPAPPLIAGREFSGVEESSGRPVMGYIQWGAFAEKVGAYSNMLWPVPDHWTDEQAAAFPVNYFTAYLGYWQAGMTQPPAAGRTHRVLIHAAAGGVGTAAVQIGHILGVEMYGTSSSDEKLERVKELGLQHGINN